jgi:hypothetical protein
MHISYGLGHTFASETVHNLFLDTLLALGKAFILSQNSEIVIGSNEQRWTNLSHCHVGELVWVCGIGQDHSKIEGSTWAV